MAKRRIEYLNEENRREHSLRPNKFWKIDLFKPQEFEEMQTSKPQEPQEPQEQSNDNV